MEPSHPTFANLTVLSHPLLSHKLVHLRDRDTPKKIFTELVDEITTLMAYEVTRNLATCEVEVETPMEATTGRRLAGREPVVVPILRAGLGMVDGVVRLIPGARVGHVGLSRDEETLTPVEYYFKLPPHPADREFIVVDPMLATGGSASAALDSLKERGVSTLRFMCIVASPEGVRALEEAHPDVPVYTAALDRTLDDRGFILPGLGDAGDRLFGTL
jgi:uracil phosphoribosyltransferase